MTRVWNSFFQQKIEMMRAARVLPVMEVKVGHLEKQNRKNMDALKFEIEIDSWKYCGWSRKGTNEPANKLSQSYYLKHKQSGSYYNLDVIWRILLGNMARKRQSSTARWMDSVTRTTGATIGRLEGWGWGQIHW